MGFFLLGLQCLHHLGGNWKAFYTKFSRYAEVSEWTEGECRDQLCWCLDGKASEYYAFLVERNQEMVYMVLYVFRSDIRGITPGLFICCPLA
jgi:hypothetical protein